MSITAPRMGCARNSGRATANPSAGFSACKVWRRERERKLARVVRLVLDRCILFGGTIGIQWDKYRSVG